MTIGPALAQDPRQAADGAPSAADKIRALGELGAISARLRRQGKRVVLCHGTFDLLHIGHVRHLEAARRHGDTLFATVTADRFVNKGPGRPVFNELLRAEMLAQLGIVDWVGVNHAYDAVSAIEAVRPSRYVKGQDYKNPEGDVTGKIVAEREAAEAHGGELVFTDEIVHSSSELINRHLNVFEPHVRQHLGRLRDEQRRDEIGALLERIAEMRVVLVGETIVDEYCYVLPMAKAAKENIIATRHKDREIFAGGVVATANHVASFCREVEIVTVLGERDSYEEHIRAALRPNVRLHAVYRPSAPTVRKCRFVDPNWLRKLFEVYYIDDAQLGPELAAELDMLVRDRVAGADVVIVNDFGHGMIGESTIRTLTEAAPFLAVNTQSNSANMGFNLVTRYPAADLVCLDALEARLATHQRNLELSDILSTCLPAAIDCPKFVVTHGPHGCLTYERGGIVHSVPAFSPKVVDTMGAGDAFLAIAAPLAAAGAGADLIGFVGNVVGAQKVEIVGHRKPVDKVSVMKAVTALLK